jgi:hypothetical protein
LNTGTNTSAPMPMKNTSLRSKGVVGSLISSKDALGIGRSISPLSRTLTSSRGTNTQIRLGRNSCLIMPTVVI